MAEITKADVISFIEKMSVLELAEMVKELEEKFGVSAAAPVAVAAVAGPAAAHLGRDQVGEQARKGRRFLVDIWEEACIYSAAVDVSGRVLARFDKRCEDAFSAWSASADSRYVVGQVENDLEHRSDLYIADGVK